MLDKKTIAGETAVLECQSSGSPEPRLAWKKNGGPLYTTERHFFTANNQLLIIVKAQARDTGRYECEMTNPLGTESQTSFLTVTDGGVGGGDGSFPTTGIIIIAVACCMVGTSCVWVLCIYFCRRRTSRTQEQGREWLPEHQTQHPLLGNEMGLMGGEGVLELAVGHPVEYKEPEGESERDSGTGDFGVLRANHPQPLAEGLGIGVVVVADHLVSLDHGLVQGPVARLALELVEAGLHVADGGLAGHLLAAGDAGHLAAPLLVLLLAGVAGLGLGRLEAPAARDGGLQLAHLAVRLLQLAARRVQRAADPRQLALVGLRAATRRL